MAETYYKFLLPGRVGAYSAFTWPRVGTWVTTDGQLAPCVRGIHACRAEHVASWANIWMYEIQLRGPIIDAGDKVVAQSGRLVRRLKHWDERAARLWSADCAERVLSIFEKACPGDDRPRLAIAAARQFARGEIDDATGDAAGDAARDAAGAAARAATWAAAGAAAGTAAWAAAWAAAGAAARAATGDAAGAAARDAAGAAARAATWAAAGAAERAWQSARLMEYAEGRVE